MQKTAVLVIGAPRSGTSLVSNVINKLGFHFGDHSRFVDPVTHPWNLNFFELQALNELNDEIIRGFGHEYFDAEWFPLKEHFNKRAIERHRADIIGFVENEFGGKKHIGLKDPRFCFTLPLWIATLSELGYKSKLVWAVRDIAACLCSNKLVDSSLAMRPERVVVSSILIAAYMLEGEDYYFCDYNKLVEHPDEQIKQIATWLEVSFENLETVCQVIRPDLRHNTVRHSRELPPFLSKLSSLLLANQLDKSYYLDLREALESYGYLTLLAQKNQHIKDLILSMTAKDIHIENLTKYADGLTKHADGLTKYADELNAQIFTLNAQASQIGSDLLEIKRSISWRITKPIRFLDEKLKAFSKTRKH